MASSKGPGNEGLQAVWTNASPQLSGAFAKRQTRLISGIQWLRADEAAELKGNH